MGTFADFGNVPANVCRWKYLKINILFVGKAYICIRKGIKILVEKQTTFYYKQLKF